jgi:hypothetical protein
MVWDIGASKDAGWGREKMLANVNDIADHYLRSSATYYGI